MGYVEDLRKLIGHRPIILTGSVVLVINEEGQLLLQQRTYPEGVWGLPGGLMELGESTEQTGVREVYEETGLSVRQLKLIDVYSGEEYFAVAENGDEFYTVTTAYYTTEYSGEVNADLDEAIQCRFIDLHHLPERMIGSHREIIEDFLERFY
ncbi:NUDIX domain-containing protein [Halobacillus litoralis]|uniref:NUDIX hydrolase n=1 Tax=Halobacillus litoralis TaxID=45668 RepID=UPI001CD6D320|nr:NUDIX domain-containing protein [Halobacillus litoralis]MCA0972365.1 NUDIX domain-containing protein [Halobacillus litoralis]